MPSPLLKAIIIAAAKAHDMSPYTVAAIASVESDFNATKIGSIGEVGVMQLRPEYHLKASETPDVLLDPQVNIYRAVKYLASLRNRCVFKAEKTWVLCYNLGPTGATRIKNPKEFPYYKKFMERYEKLKAQKTFGAI